MQHRLITHKHSPSIHYIEEEEESKVEMGNESSERVLKVITCCASKNTENGSDPFCFSCCIYGRPETANAAAGTTENEKALGAFRLLPD